MCRPISVVLTMATGRIPTTEVPFGQSLTFIGTLPKVIANPYTCQRHCVVLLEIVKTPLPLAAASSFK